MDAGNDESHRTGSLISNDKYTPLIIRPEKPGLFIFRQNNVYIMSDEVVKY